MYIFGVFATIIVIQEIKNHKQTCVSMNHFARTLRASPSMPYPVSF